jgi:hypothetical protein
VTKTPGIYVIEFPGCVKIGRAADLRWRLRDHARGGARRIRAFPLDEAGSYFGGRSWSAEGAALDAVAAVGRRDGPGRTERFTGLTFDLASSIAESAVTRVIGRVVETYEVDIDQLLTRPTRLARITEREDT